MLTAPPPTPQLEYRFWQWQGHPIRYTCQGTGQPLLLIHGFGGAIGHWRRNIPAWVEAGYQVFALDLLGFGGSAKPDLPYNIELWQDLLHDFWQAHIQQPVVWIGNSIGGLLSLSMAAHYPNLTQGLVLLNCAGSLNHRPSDLSPPLRMVMQIFNNVVSSPALGPWLFNQIRQPRRLRNTLRQVYCDSSAITDELINIIYQPTCDPGAQKVFATILTAPPGPEPAELLPRITTPVLVIWGEADPWTPVSAGKIFQTWQDRLHLKFVTIPKTGHCPHDERPDVVNPLVIDWLAQA